MADESRGIKDLLKSAAFERGIELGSGHEVEQKVTKVTKDHVN